MASTAPALAVTLRAARNELLFRCDADRRDFVARLCEAFAGRGGRCLAWALLPDRAELVLRGDPPELAERLAELEARYARGFNRRNRRRGYLFADLPELRPVPARALRARIRDALLAPWRAGDAPTLRELENHPWSGLGGLTGARPRHPFEATRAAPARAAAANVVRREFTPFGGTPTSSGRAS